MDNEMFNFLESVFACEIEGKPYTRLMHTEQIVKRAIDYGYVAPCLFEEKPSVGLTYLGQHEFCQECNKRI